MNNTESIIKQINELDQVIKKHPPSKHLQEVCEDIVENYKDTLFSLVGDRAGTLAKIVEDTKQSQITFNKIRDNRKKGYAVSEALRLKLFQKQKKHFEQSKKAISELCNYGQEPKKPLQYCRFGHVIFVSTCKYHHKELPGKMRIQFEQTIDLMKKEKLLGIRLNQLNPKDWLIKKYTRFFWLDYKERMN